MAKISSREILWNSISRTCFQDRVMPYNYWLSAITDPNHHEHKKVLEQSIAMLAAMDFIKLIGEREFAKLWKSIRNDVVPTRTSVRQGKSILDGLWSTIVTGFAFSKCDIAINKPISSGLKSTYLDICKYSSRNIYQVAKDTKRPYNRVHGDTKKLEALGLVKVVTGTHEGRSVKLLSVAY